MSLTLEKRVEALETRFAELADAIQARPARIAWRSVVGMFADDPQIDELHRETQRIREEDRAEVWDGDTDES